jgi:hypothetical protein
MRYEIFEQVMLKLLDDIDYSILDKDVTPVEEQQKAELNEVLFHIIESKRLRNRYLRIIEGDAEPDDEIIRRYKETTVELKALQTRQEALQRAINATVSPKLEKIPTIHYRTWKERNLFLKDEIRKRVAQIVLTFKVELLSAPDPDRSIAGVRPGKGHTVARITFTNGATKWAFIDGLKATLLW